MCSPLTFTSAKDSVLHPVEKGEARLRWLAASKNDCSTFLFRPWLAIKSHSKKSGFGAYAPSPELVRPFSRRKHATPHQGPEKQRGCQPKKICAQFFSCRFRVIYCVLCLEKPFAKKQRKQQKKKTPQRMVVLKFPRVTHSLAAARLPAAPNFKSVSYTHLDVYKRQEQKR